MTTTWKDVERVHKLHPDWTAPEIAAELKCSPAYVRATSARREYPIPIVSHDGVSVRVAAERIMPFCLLGETPHRCLYRIVNMAIERETKKARAR